MGRCSRISSSFLEMRKLMPTQLSTVSTLSRRISRPWPLWTLGTAEELTTGEATEAAATQLPPEVCSQSFLWLLSPSSGSRVRFSISVSLRRAKESQGVQGMPAGNIPEHASDSVYSGNMMTGERLRQQGWKSLGRQHRRGKEAGDPVMHTMREGESHRRSRQWREDYFPAGEV